MWADTEGEMCAVPFTEEIIYSDWDDQLCNIRVLTPQSRCALDPVASSRFRTICSANTVGCESIPGGCIGSLEPGHWSVVQVVVDNQLVERRCVCGCFGEETAIETNRGRLTGTQMLNEKDRIEAGDALFVSSSDWDAEPLKYSRITQITAGTETEQAYTIRTKSGRKITLSGNHPVYIASPDNTLTEVRKAEALEVGLALSTIDGGTDIIEKIEKGTYSDRMVNFTVDTASNGEHFIFGNQIKIGDNAWQQFLARKAARILTRNQILLHLIEGEKKKM